MEKSSKGRVFRPPAESINWHNKHMLDNGFVRVGSGNSWSWLKRDDCWFYDGHWHKRIDFVCDRLGGDVVTRELQNLLPTLPDSNPWTALVGWMERPENRIKYQLKLAVLCEAAGLA